MTRHDPTLIKQLLFRAGLRLHEPNHWNQPDMLMFLHSRDDHLEVGLLEQNPLPDQVDPEHFLLMLAEVARRHPPAVESFGFTVPDLYAFGVITQGYVTTQDLDAEDFEGREKPEDWVSHPTLRPCKLITLIDVYGQVFHAEYVLGETPKVAQDDDVDDFQVIGTPVEALRQIFIEILKTMPANPERTEAIARLQEMIVPTTKDTIAVAKLRADRFNAS